MKIVRKDDETLRIWLKRYQAEGIQGSADNPRSGGPKKVTEAYREKLLQAVLEHPRNLGQPYSMWTLRRLADYLAEQTGLRVEVEKVECTIRRVLSPMMTKICHGRKSQSSITVKSQA